MTYIHTYRHTYGHAYMHKEMHTSILIPPYDEAYRVLAIHRTAFTFPHRLASTIYQSQSHQYCPPIAVSSILPTKYAILMHQACIYQSQYHQYCPSSMQYCYSNHAPTNRSVTELAHNLCSINLATSIMQLSNTVSLSLPINYGISLHQACLYQSQYHQYCPSSMQACYSNHASINRSSINIAHRVCEFDTSIMHLVIAVASILPIKYAILLHQTCIYQAQ